ncbi:hypothetical protein BGZ83_000133 [Gryganskiella cystojenkinii]|nr:hypothetical protein BGZ83_000133 [Gryganskiella cystojenkinii]
MVASGNFYQYVPATNTWSNITGTGDHAGKLARHCMVSAYGGTKLVLFGGIDTTLHETGQLHFLDLTTMVWTAGTNSISARSSMACAVAGDSFLVWGGSANSTVVSNTPLIYNMRTNLWVNQFDPPSQTTTTPAGGSVGGSPPSVTNTSPPDTSSSHGSNVGAIGGGVGAGIALIAIIAALIIFRRRKAKRQNIKDGNGLTAGEKALELRLLVDGRDRCDQSPPLQGSRLQPQPSPQPPLLSPPILAPRPLSYGISIVDRSPVSHQHLVSAAEPPPPPRHTSGSVSSTRSLTNPNSPVIYMPLPTPRTVYDQLIYEKKRQYPSSESSIARPGSWSILIQSRSKIPIS